MKPYRSPKEISLKLEPFLKRIISRLQGARLAVLKAPEHFLEQLDLGDGKAENEEQQLRSYFVTTGQFRQAKRGYARLVIGRKGSGKSAIFYAIRDSLPRSHSNFVLDLKPEGYQFGELRDTVLSHLTVPVQEHLLTAFWTYVPLCEIAYKIGTEDASWAHRDPTRMMRFRRVVELYRQRPHLLEGADERGVYRPYPSRVAES